MIILIMLCVFCLSAGAAAGPVAQQYYDTIDNTTKKNLENIQKMRPTQAFVTKKNREDTKVLLEILSPTEYGRFTEPHRWLEGYTTEFTPKVQEDKDYVKLIPIGGKVQTLVYVNPENHFFDVMFDAGWRATKSKLEAPPKDKETRFGLIDTVSKSLFGLGAVLAICAGMVGTKRGQKR